MASRVTARQSV